MTFLIIAGFVALVAGIMFILFPKAFSSITDWANKFAADIDDMALRYRIGIGISLILCAAFLWFSAYYMYAMPILEGIN